MRWQLKLIRQRKKGSIFLSFNVFSVNAFLAIDQLPHRIDGIVVSEEEITKNVVKLLLFLSEFHFFISNMRKTRVSGISAMLAVRNFAEYFESNFVAAFGSPIQSIVG